MHLRAPNAMFRFLATLPSSPYRAKGSKAAFSKSFELCTFTLSLFSVGWSSCTVLSSLLPQIRNYKNTEIQMHKHTSRNEDNRYFTFLIAFSSPALVTMMVIMMLMSVMMILTMNTVVLHVVTAISTAYNALLLKASCFCEPGQKRE